MSGLSIIMTSVDINPSCDSLAYLDEKEGDGVSALISLTMWGLEGDESWMNQGEYAYSSDLIAYSLQVKLLVMANCDQESGNCKE